jgi:hypothetical protein
MVARVDAETTCWNFSGPNDAVGQFELATVAHFASDKQKYRGKQKILSTVKPRVTHVARRLAGSLALRVLGVDDAIC